MTDPVEIDRILAAARIGRLATVGRDGYPYVTPVNYVNHRGRIYFHCAPKGEKLDNIARDPKVCFQVDLPLAYLDGGFDPQGRPCRLHQLYHCVIIRGTARVLPDGHDKLEALNALVAVHEAGRSAEPVTADLPAYRACAVVEVTPDAVSAKSDLAQGKNLEVRRDIAAYLAARDRPGDRETVRAMGFDSDFDSDPDNDLDTPSALRGHAKKNKTARTGGGSAG